MLSTRVKIFFLFLGDLIIFSTALLLANWIKFGTALYQKEFIISIKYFAVVFSIWFLLFFISRLYELPYLRNRKEFFVLALKLFIVGALLSLLIFIIWTPQYVPKVVLFLTLCFSLIGLTLWRTIFNFLVVIPKVPVLLLEEAPEREYLEKFIRENPQLGYYLARKEDIRPGQKCIVVTNNTSEHLFPNNKNIIFMHFGDFYEQITQTVPLSQLNVEFFKKNYKYNIVYEFIKRICDIIGGIILLIISLPLWLIIALLIKITSEGPVLYRSKRVGLHQKDFLIYKFRTMVKDADKIGPAWTLKNDTRITWFGKLLRKTHLDELPQVLNIIKGDTSFIGPRPEEKKLVELFKKEIPFYEKRFLIKPGIVGWAQINYPHGSSVEDAKHKLEYDFYYLKHRSLIFDFLIAVKAWRIPFEIPTH